jgi:hypothetical protein
MRLSIVSMNTGKPPPLPIHVPKPGAYSSHLHVGFTQVNNSFAPWEVALTVADAIALMATVVLFVRRLRPR